MEILIIGNGFDLAHGLPTKYSDFLEFLRIIKSIVLDNQQIEHIDWKRINVQIKDMIKSNCENKRENLYNQKENWRQLIEDNIWIDYFQNNEIYQRENWIDFENEIAKVIQCIDSAMGEDFDEKVYKLDNTYLNKRFTNSTPEYLQATLVEEQKRIEKKLLTFRELRDKLLRDLNNLISALEIYLCDYINGKGINVWTPKINKINPDLVISFNYTKTYEDIYGNEKIRNGVDIEYDYVHGEANTEKVKNNMVLGIDEYLDEERKNKDIEFIAFKKYYQRIYKQTGCEYRKWIDKIKQDNDKYLKEQELQENLRKVELLSSNKEKNNLNTIVKKCEKHKIFIFGHSLDITDKDILKDLILNDNVEVIIFYHDMDALGERIANLVKVIGQDELVKRTGGEEKQIIFKDQNEIEQDEIEDWCEIFNCTEKALNNAIERVGYSVAEIEKLLK